MIDIADKDIQDQLDEIFGELPYIWDIAWDKPEIIVVQLLGGSSLPPYNFKVNDAGNIYFI
jgi:hypothetical protein